MFYRWSKRAFRHRWSQIAGVVFLTVMARVLVPACWLALWWDLTTWV